MRKRRKAMGEAVDGALMKLCVDLQQRFPEFTADEVVRAVFIHAGKRRQREIERKRREECEAKSAAFWEKHQRKFQSHIPVDQARAELFGRLQEESERKRRERETQREVSQQIINAGYRAMAAKAHPDVGGSAADMQVLNAAKDHLKKMA